MPRDATATRSKLLRAGAELFAAQGIDAALTREIVQRAGQRNDAAITYHFGSRQGLLESILRAGVARMEPARKADLAQLQSKAPQLADVVAAVVEPIAAELHTAEGRDFVRIVAQVAGRSGVRGGALPSLIEGTALAEELALLQKLCRAFLPEDIARERLALFISFLTAALADRANGHQLLDHGVFTGNLIAMLTASLGTPLQLHETMPS